MLSIAMQVNGTSAVCFSFTKYFKQISLLRSVLPWNKRNAQLNKILSADLVLSDGCEGGFVSH